MNFSAEIKKIDIGTVKIEKVKILTPNKGTAKSHVIKKNTSSKTGNSGKKVGNKTAPKKLYGIGRFVNIDEDISNITKELDKWRK